MVSASLQFLPIYAANKRAAFCPYAKVITLRFTSPFFSAS